MADPLDILSSIRAVLNGGGAQPAYHTRLSTQNGGSGLLDRDRERSAELDNLKWENRALKANVDKLERELKEIKSRPSPNAEGMQQQRTLLVQAQDALVRYHTEIDTLKHELSAREAEVQRGKQTRKDAETKAHSATVQQSQMGKEKSNLEKRVEQLGAEVDRGRKELERVEGLRSALSNENRDLKQRAANPATSSQYRSLQDSLTRAQERAHAAEKQVKLVEDQMKQMRRNNDGLRAQCKRNDTKASFQAHPSSTSPGPATPMPKSSTSPSKGAAIALQAQPISDILAIQRSRYSDNPFWMIIHYILTHLPTIFDSLPHLGRAIREIINMTSTRRVVSLKSKSKHASRRQSGKRSGADGKQADLEQKLTAEKATLKHRLHTQEKEIAKLLDKNESLARQNRELFDGTRGSELTRQDFKERERESEHENSRKKAAEQAQQKTVNGDTSIAQQERQHSSLRPPIHPQILGPPLIPQMPKRSLTAPVPLSDPPATTGSTTKPKAKPPLSMEELVMLGTASVKLDPFKDLDKAFNQGPGPTIPVAAHPPQAQATVEEKVQAWRRPVEMESIKDDTELEGAQPIRSSPEQSHLDFMYGGAAV